MEKELISAREKVMDKVDQVLDSVWPDCKGDYFTDEMNKALSALQEIAKRMETEGVQEVELSKTYSYLGQVYSDLAPALGNEMLMKAKESYLRAEKLLNNCNDEMAMAKLNFNYANTLRQIDPNDINLLLEAKKRFESAGSYFAVHSPQYLPRVEEGLFSVNNLLAIAPVANKVSSTINQLEEINNEMKSGKDLHKIYEKMKELQKKGGGIAGQIGEIYGVLNKVSIHTKDQKKVEEIRQELNKIALKAAESPDEPDPETSKILNALFNRLNKDIKSGVVDKPGAQVMRDIIDQMKNILSSENENVEVLLKKGQTIRNMLANQIELVHYLSHGIPRPPQDSKAARLVEMCWLLRRYILEEFSRTGKGPEESDYNLKLNIKAATVDKHLYEAGDNDIIAAKFDHIELRPFSLEVRNFSSRYYPMIAQPIWSVANVSVNVNMVFFSGTPEQERRTISKMSNSGYLFSEIPQGHSFAEAKWRQLRSAMTTVFDFRLAEGISLAAIAYELGIAITIGKPVVIIIDENQKLPFDIEIKPIVLGTNSSDYSILLDEVEQSLFWTYPRPDGKPYLSTINYVLNEFLLPDSNVYINQTLKMLNTDEEGNDPLHMDNVLKKLVDFLNDGKTMIIHPLFPPEYPQSDKKRVFHVTPFRPDWAAETSNRIRKTCERLNAKYIRGDEAEEANVIASIWSEIAKASYIVADLTGFNANVALELGIAHTLGRPTLMIGQKETLDKLFPMIAKLRVAPYNQPKELDEIIKKFLN